MSEFIIPIISTAVGVSIGSLVTTFIVKRSLSTENILEKLEDLSENIQTNPALQQRIYMVGGILGKGIRDGVGIDKMMPKRKGGIEGMLYDLVGSFIGNKIGFGQQQGEQEAIEPQQIERTRAPRW